MCEHRPALGEQDADSPPIALLGLGPDLMRFREQAAGIQGHDINGEILRLYTALHAGGHAHSIECWQNGVLVGGLYGVRLGAAFFGESMFSHERDASKVALVHLVEGLRRGGFVLLDTQFITAHLTRFGAVEIPRAQYLVKLADALNREAIWPFF